MINPTNTPTNVEEIIITSGAVDRKEGDTFTQIDTEGGYYNYVFINGDWVETDEQFRPLDKKSIGEKAFERAMRGI